MKTSRIECAADVAAIEAHPYAGFMAHQSIGAALEDAAARHPDRPALCFVESVDDDASTRSWSHREFMDRVRRAAGLFKALAGNAQPRVAMLLPGIPQAYFTLWGAEIAGVVCPINYLLDADHIAELIRASEANILVALGPHPALDIWSRTAGLQAACPGLLHVLAVGSAPDAPDLDALLDAQEALPWRQTTADDPHRIAALFHTGGTTGAPKLAQHTHGNQLHAAWGAAQMYGTTADDAILNGFPLFHVAGAFVYGLSTLLSGGCVVLPTLLGMRNQAVVKHYWTLADRCGITLIAAVPTVIAALMTTECTGVEIRKPRACLTGGSPLPGELATQFERKFGIPVRNILGMTECAGVISIEPLRGPRTPGSCGLALPFTVVQAVAADGSGRTCAADESGILRVRGPNVGPGYTDARRNAGTFGADGWLITGDIGHVDAEGRLFVTGRAKDVIIRSSHNIDPAMIEEALLMHPDVQMAAAVGEPDEYAGEIPMAFVMLKPGARVSLEELSAFAQSRIPERPACPRRLELMPAIPMTAIGKVYKPALRLRATQHVLASRLATASLDQDYVVEGVDEASGIAVIFRCLSGASSPSGEAAIAGIMAGFAIRYRIEAALDARQ
jgi:fatty-acyl-CoA synthase